MNPLEAGLYALLLTALGFGAILFVLWLFVWLYGRWEARRVRRALDERWGKGWEDRK